MAHLVMSAKEVDSMRVKRLVLILLSVFMWLTTLTFQKTESLAAEGAYDEIINHYYERISQGFEGFEIDDGDIGVSEIVQSSEAGEAPSRIGYMVQDITGDNIPELLIGAIDELHDAIAFGDEILAVYTLVDSSPRLTFEGWGRNAYRLAEGGRFVYHGSAGAMYTLFGVYSLSEDGQTLINDEFYFSHENETMTEVGYYYNQLGEFDKDVSTELAISANNFWKIEMRLDKLVRNIELIPFSRHEPSSAITDARTQVQVAFAHDVLANYSDYIEFEADSNSESTDVVFFSEHDVEGFQFLALTLEDADEAGNIVFATETLYDMGVLTADRPFVVHLTFFGTIPNYGIAFTDESGNRRQFALTMSGLDGSLGLIEF